MAVLSVSVDNIRCMFKHRYRPTVADRTTMHLGRLLALLSEVCVCVSVYVNPTDLEILEQHIHSSLLHLTRSHLNIQKK